MLYLGAYKQGTALPYMTKYGSTWAKGPYTYLV